LRKVSPQREMFFHLLPDAAFEKRHLWSRTLKLMVFSRNMVATDITFTKIPWPDW